MPNRLKSVGAPLAQRGLVEAAPVEQVEALEGDHWYLEAGFREPAFRHRRAVDEQSQSVPAAVIARFDTMFLRPLESARVRSHGQHL